ncbi:MAG: hypothetical protein P8X74_19685 [Reinekea sp.]
MACALRRDGVTDSGISLPGTNLRQYTQKTLGIIGFTPQHDSICC